MLLIFRESAATTAPQSEKAPAMPLTPRLERTLAAATLTVAGLLSTLATAQVGDGTWVRIDEPASHPALERQALRERLADYGSFQWGRLDAARIDELRRSGLTVNERRDPFELVLGGQRFDPLDLPDAAGTRDADPEGDFHLVQFDGPIRPQWLRSLRARGIEIIQPLHPFSYIVWADPDRMAAARSLPHLRWQGPFRNEWKLTPSQRFAAAGRRPTMALASAHFDAERLRRELAEFGPIDAMTPLGRHYTVLQLEADGRDYPAIAGIPGILTVQHIPPGAGPRGEMSNQSVVGGIDGGGDVVPGYADWLIDAGHDGSGIKVGVVDGRVLATHQDLADRMAPCTGTNGSCGPAASNDHGTHVAAAIAGTGATGITDDNGFLRGQGVARGAEIVSQVYQPFIDDNGSGGMVADGMLKIYRDSADSGALLTNNSWGPTDVPQGYDIPTQQIDFISRDADPDTPGNQPVLAVWSIMNGNGDSGGGTCAPSSLGSPDEAKNLFAVGSTWLQNGFGNQRAGLFSISGNSAHGPACDGRRVPHIVAPGCNTDSASSAGNAAHTLKCGTSMASPVVSGAVALWAERHIAETGHPPSPALVKAVFTAAARNLEGGSNADGGPLGHRPDRFQGYGRLDLEAVMDPGAAVYLHDQALVFDASGQEWTAVFEPADPSEPVRVMLAWTDAPGHGMGGSTPAWVNDLDLSVVSDGATYRGNVIGSDGWSTTGGSADGMNNLEGVFLSPAQAGQGFAITVSAANLGGDALDPYDPGDPSQDFALACYNCVESEATFTLTASPNIIEVCIPETGSNAYQSLLEVGAVGPYDGSVSLVTSGLPAGSSAVFSPSSVVVPGSSTWSVDVGAATQPGLHTAVLSADDGVEQRSDSVFLDMEARLEAVPTLLSPADGEEGRTQPEFVWEALPGVSQYRVQVARDETFVDIVADGVVNGTSYTPSVQLETGTSYYWRVQGFNNCGAGEWSGARLVTTLIFDDRFEMLP
jgi:hypothetical protein